jgi:GNAT superfamily N-acetyltransferase
MHWHAAVSRRSQQPDLRLAVLTESEWLGSFGVRSVRAVPPHVTIRRLRTQDGALVAAALQALGWARDAHEYEEYARQDASGARSCFVAESDSEIAGYCTLLWQSKYAPFRESNIPEVSDLNVLPRHRNRGIGSRLLDAVGAEAAKQSLQVGLGVGLHADYGPAQRLYVRRGYVPDGRGIMHDNEPVEYGTPVRIDDDATLMLVRSL